MLLASSPRMRPSPLRHTLAILRTTIGLTQKEMAELAECSTATIQAIELGKLKLSMKLATNLYAQTGVGLAWLMQDNVSQPAVDFEGKNYTRERFERVQASLFAPREESSAVRRDLFFARACFRNAVEHLAILLLHAYRNDGVQLYHYKIFDALGKLFSQIVPRANLSPEEEARLRKLRLKAYKLPDLLAPVHQFVAETETIFQNRIADFEPTIPAGQHPENANELPPGHPRVSRRKTRTT